VKYSLYQLALPTVASDFVLFNLQVESKVLAANLLQESPRKHHYVLQSRKQKPTMVVFHLSGYFGNGTQSFNPKTLEENFPQQMMNLSRRGKIPSALHVFVDGMTAWGGGQFINSDLFGCHSDHLQQELVPLIKSVFPLDHKAPWVVMGASSGGYGALHHVSLPKSPFRAAIAIAPDADFTTSLLPDFYKASPYLKSLSNITQVQKALQSRELQKKKNFFQIINALAMTGCYSPMGENKKLQFPIDLSSGEMNNAVWAKWKQKDPIYFLNQRSSQLSKKTVYLEVGEYDDFCLYFGARKIRDVLKRKKIKMAYTEFPGTHFGLNERKLKALQWLLARRF
jgi:enterochelin esterase family protein